MDVPFMHLKSHSKRYSVDRSVNPSMFLPPFGSGDKMMTLQQVKDSYYLGSHRR